MQFVKPNVLHRPGPAVSEDHGFADKLGLGFFESAEDRGRPAAFAADWRSYSSS
jgi:hypothetical protein